MADGSTIEADLIVFCTGFNGNMRTRVARMVGPEIADQLDDYFCFDAEGEVRGNWKPIGRKNKHSPAQVNELTSIFRSCNMVCRRHYGTLTVLLEVHGFADQGGHRESPLRAIPGELSRSGLSIQHVWASVGGCAGVRAEYFGGNTLAAYWQLVGLDIQMRIGQVYDSLKLCRSH
jgi:hypothetical protein